MSGDKIFPNPIKGRAILELFKRLIQLFPNGNLAEKYKIKPRINPPSIKPKTAPAKRLIVYKNGIKVKKSKNRY